MIDVIAWYGTRAGAAAFTYISPAPGDALHPSTNNGQALTVPFQCYALGAALGVSNTLTSGRVTQMQLYSPSLQQSSRLDLANFISNAAGSCVPGNEPPMDLFWDNPIPLQPGEAVQVFDINSGTNSETTALVLFMTDGNNVNPIQLPALTSVPPFTRIETVRCTTSTTVNAGTWTPAPLSFTQQLRNGTYAIGGMRVSSATGIAARLIIQNQSGTSRPGCPCVNTTYNNVDSGLDKFRYFRLGSWGLFSYQSPPQIEFLCSSADTSAEVFLDLIKVS